MKNINIVLIVVITLESLIGNLLYKGYQQEVKNANRKIELLRYQNSLFEDEILKMRSRTKKTTTSATVRVTAYHPKSKGINSDSSPETTATMTKPRAGKTAAISSSLFKKGWLGKKVYIDGYGVFIIEDRMSKSLKGDRIDLCVGSRRVAQNFKTKDDVHATILVK
jgi:3D (Asp-Asp-Asp) domain-containing protein